MTLLFFYIGQNLTDFQNAERVFVAVTRPICFVTVIRYSGLSGGSNRLAVTSRYLYFSLIYALKFRLMIARILSESADRYKPLLAVTHPDVTKRLAVTLNYPNTCPVSFQGRDLT